MASSPSAKKRIRQNIKKRARNRWRKRSLKDVLKDLEDKLAHGAEVTQVQTAFRAACQLLDRTAQKGVIHANTAARKKSRLSARVKARQHSTDAPAANKAKTTKTVKAVKPAGAAKSGGAAKAAAPAKSAKR